jgi:hypothetical protein
LAGQELTAAGSTLFPPARPLLATVWVPSRHHAPDRSDPLAVRRSDPGGGVPRGRGRAAPFRHPTGRPGRPRPACAVGGPGPSSSTSPEPAAGRATS